MRCHWLSMWPGVDYPSFKLTVAEVVGSGNEDLNIDLVGHISVGWWLWIVLRKGPGLYLAWYFWFIYFLKFYTPNWLRFVGILNCEEVFLTWTWTSVFFFKGEFISTEIVDSLPNVEQKNFSESLGNYKIFHSDSYLKWNKTGLNEGRNDSVVVEIVFWKFFMSQISQDYKLWFFHKCKMG